MSGGRVAVCDDFFTCFENGENVKLLRVEFEACVNLGNYEHEKIRLVADVADIAVADDVGVEVAGGADAVGSDAESEGFVATLAELVEHTVDELRDLVLASASIDMTAAVRRRAELTRQLADLEIRTKRAREDYGRAMDFLVAQGLKRRGDVRDFPEFVGLLPSPDVEREEVVAELVDDDDEL